MIDLNEEDRGVTVNEMLDWICWSVATTGERFFPPRETAEECISTFESRGEVDMDALARGKEHGQHSRAWCDATILFNDMKSRGFDPRGRAEREIERSRAEGLNLSDIDWEWWEVTQ